MYTHAKGGYVPYKHTEFICHLCGCLYIIDEREEIGFRRKHRHQLSVNFGLAFLFLIKIQNIAVHSEISKFKLFKLNLHPIISDQISSYFFNQHL